MKPYHFMLIDTQLFLQESAVLQDDIHFPFVQEHYGRRVLLKIFNDIPGCFVASLLMQLFQCWWVSKLHSNTLVTGASSSTWWILLTGKFGGIILSAPRTKSCKRQGWLKVKVRVGTWLSCVLHLLKSFNVYFLLAMSSWSYDCPTYTSNFLFSSTTKDWFPSISCCKMCKDHSSTLSHM